MLLWAEMLLCQFKSKVTFQCFPPTFMFLCFETELEGQRKQWGCSCNTFLVADSNWSKAATQPSYNLWRREETSMHGRKRRPGGDETQVAQRRGRSVVQRRLHSGTNWRRIKDNTDSAGQRTLRLMMTSVATSVNVMKSRTDVMNAYASVQGTKAP